jgi:hypothetical protein
MRHFTDLIDDSCLPKHSLPFAQPLSHFILLLCLISHPAVPMSRVVGSVELEGTILLKFYLNEVVSRSPGPRWRRRAVIGTAPSRQGNTTGNIQLIKPDDPNEL